MVDLPTSVIRNDHLFIGETRDVGIPFADLPPSGSVKITLQRCGDNEWHFAVAFVDDQEEPPASPRLH